MVGLDEFLKDRERMPFGWASNNCMSFVSDGLKACGHSGLPDKWCSGYTTAHAALGAYRSCLSEFGYETVIEAFDHLFERVLTLHPKNGMICARKTAGVMGHAFGITYRSNCVFLTEEGAMSFDVEAGDIFWRAD